MNGNWKIGQGVATFEKDPLTGVEKMIGTGPIKVPPLNEQPFYGSVRFKFNCHIVERCGVAIHELFRKGIFIHFQLVDGKGSSEFGVHYDDI